MISVCVILLIMLLNLCKSNPEDYRSSSLKYDQLRLIHDYLLFAFETLISIKPFRLIIDELEFRTSGERVDKCLS